MDLKLRILIFAVLFIIGPAFKKDDYVFERIYAPSHDGEDIPMTIVSKKNIKKNRQ